MVFSNKERLEKAMEIQDKLRGMSIDNPEREKLEKRFFDIAPRQYIMRLLQIKLSNGLNQFIEQIEGDLLDIECITLKEIEKIKHNITYYKKNIFRLDDSKIGQKQSVGKRDEKSEFI